MEERNELVLTVEDTDAGQRLDRFAAEHTELSRSAIERLISDSWIEVNGASATKNQRLRAGDIVMITFPEAEECEALPENIPLDIIYEDDDLIVLNKPVGMVVHPAPGNASGTLVNALLWHCGDSLSGIGGVKRPGIVHRIDKDTSGLLVVAKNDDTHIGLAAQLKGHRINRIYHAVVIGNLKDDQGTIDAPIGRHPIDRKRMAVIRNEAIRSREAVTHWTVLARGCSTGQSFTLVRCELETGRTHQIRVHMASIGHPLLGDPLYGGTGTRFEASHKALLEGQALHAKELIFTHPRTGKQMHFTAPLPENMQRLVSLLFEEA